MFTPDPSVEPILLDDGTTITAGWDTWADRLPAPGSPAIRVSIYSEGNRFDPISSSTIPIGYISPIVKLAVHLAERDLHNQTQR